LEFADQNGIDCPSQTNQRGRLSKAEADKKRQRIESDPLKRYKDWYDALITDFVKHLSDKFNTDNYRPLMAISNILLSKTKKENKFGNL